LHARLRGSHTNPLPTLSPPASRAPAVLVPAEEKASKKQLLAAAKADKAALQGELDDARDDMDRLQQQVGEHEATIDRQTHDICELEQARELLEQGGARQAHAGRQAWRALAHSPARQPPSRQLLLPLRATDMRA
jgi:septal ring factor EnvC (AmiA/AmiB activator)